MQQLTLYYDVNFRVDVLEIVKCHSLKYTISQTNKNSH